MKKFILNTTILLSLFTTIFASEDATRCVAVGAHRVEVPWAGTPDVYSRVHKAVFIKFLKDASIKVGKNNAAKLFGDLEALLNKGAKVTFLQVLALGTPVAANEATDFAKTFCCELINNQYVANGGKFIGMLDGNRVLGAKELARWLSN